MGIMLRMRALPAGFIAPCLPTKTDKLPSGSQWLHEIKHDGFRVIARKDGPRVRLYSRPGNDLTRRFPLIVETLARLAAWPPARAGRHAGHRPQRIAARTTLRLAFKVVCFAPEGGPQHLIAACRMSARSRHRSDFHLILRISPRFGLMIAFD